MKTKLTVAILCCVLICSTLYIPVFAADTSGGEKLTTFTFDNSANPFTISAVDNTLVITNAPAINHLEKLMITFKDCFDKTIKNFYATRDASGGASVDLSSFKNGKYYMQLFTEKKGGGYISILKDKLFPVIITNKAASFPIPVFYDENQRVMAAQKSNTDSQEVLDFYLKESTDVQSTDPKIVELSNTITASCTDDYGKILAVHDWVCSNIYYDLDALEVMHEEEYYSALYTMKHKRSICAGYANLTAALLRAAGIPTKIVAGYGGDAFNAVKEEFMEYSDADENHGWNMAYCSSQNRWITLDTTWDSAGNVYENEAFGKRQPIGHLYFDPTPYALALDHRVDEATGDNQFQDEGTALGYILLEAGKTFKVPDCYSISGVRDDDLSYESSDPSVATVKFPKIKGITIGTAKISVVITDEDTGNKYSSVVYVIYVTPPKATIVYNLTGDYSSDITERLRMQKGYVLSTPPSPTRKGYKFKGWKDDLGKTYKFPLTVKEDTVLYADWVKDKKVSK